MLYHGQTNQRIIITRGAFLIINEFILCTLTTNECFLSLICFFTKSWDNRRDCFFSNSISNQISNIIQSKPVANKAILVKGNTVPRSEKKIPNKMQQIMPSCALSHSSNKAY